MIKPVNPSEIALDQTGMSTASTSISGIGRCDRRKASKNDIQSPFELPFVPDSGAAAEVLRNSEGKHCCQLD